MQCDRRPATMSQRCLFLCTYKRANCVGGVDGVDSAFLHYATPNQRHTKP